MAHFISGVTHQKLDQRREDITQPDIKGLKPLNDFVAYIRCAENVAHYSMNDSNESLLWTGNQDGTISIRRGVLGEVVKTIDRKRNVFVYCLLQCGSQMWAGLSDGYVRVYDISTFALVFETKMHSGGITCMLSIHGHIFTGGYDWQILQWDPAQLNLAPRGQYSGHQNAVRCMATDGNTLYSGGDDHSIRCWDLDLGQEKVAPWPIIGHRDGIRALVVVEVYLFSASQDGTVKVWNTQTAQLVRVLDRREAAYYTMMYDRSCDRMWAGNTDGTITVWNATSLDPVATLTEHTGSSVVRLHPINRVNATKAWSYAADGSVKVWFSESDTCAGESSLLELTETAHHRTVESMRNSIIHNYGQLECRRREVDGLEFLESQRKSKMVRSMMHSQHASLASTYFAKLLAWRTRRNTYRKMNVTAFLMHKNAKQRLRQTYFSKLRNYIQVRREYLRKRELGETMLRSTENGLKLVYLHTLLQFSRAAQIRNHQKRVVSIMAQGNKLVTLKILFAKWLSFRQHARISRQEGLLCNKLSQTQHRALLAHYWNILLTRSYEMNEGTSRSAITASLQRNTEIGLMRNYYLKLVRFTDRGLGKRSTLAAEALMAGNSKSTLRCYFEKLRRYRGLRQSMSLEAQLKEITSKIQGVESLVRRQGSMNLESIERDLSIHTRWLDQSIESVERSKEEHEAEIAKLQLLKNEQRKARSGYVLDTKGDGQFDSAVALLKVLLNCDYHFDYITESQAKCIQDPQKRFDGGIRKVAAAYREALAPRELSNTSGGEWIISNDVIEKIVRTKKLSNLAKEGLSDIVVSSDIMKFQGTQTSSSAPASPTSPSDVDAQTKSRNEFLLNINSFIDLAMALQKYQKDLLARRQYASGTFSPSASAAFSQQASLSKFASGSYTRATSNSNARTELSPQRSVRVQSSTSLSPKSSTVTRSITSSTRKASSPSLESANVRSPTKGYDSPTRTSTTRASSKAQLKNSSSVVFSPTSKTRTSQSTTVSQPAASSWTSTTSVTSAATPSITASSTLMQGTVVSSSTTAKAVDTTQRGYSAFGSPSTVSGANSSYTQSSVTATGSSTRSVTDSSGLLGARTTQFSTTSAIPSTSTVSGANSSYTQSSVTATGSSTRSVTDSSGLLGARTTQFSTTSASPAVAADSSSLQSLLNSYSSSSSTSTYVPVSTTAVTRSVETTSSSMLPPLASATNTFMNSTVTGTSGSSYVSSVVTTTTITSSSTTDLSSGLMKSSSFGSANLGELNLTRDIVSVPEVPYVSALDKFLKTQVRN